MNQNRLRLSASTPPAAAIDALQARFGFRVAACLTERSAALEPDLTERLRFARENALERARSLHAAGAAPAVAATRSGALLLGSPGRWMRLASILPVVALIGGLFMIQRAQDNAQISVAAEIDSALLADDLPPRAYSDSGFVEFLKSPVE